MTKSFPQYDVSSQTNFICRLEWGRDGATTGALRGDLIVIIDTLSFSTAVITAVHEGAVVYPCSSQEELAGISDGVIDVKSVGRSDVPNKGQFSLSQETLFDIEPETRICLVSPNGAACCLNAENSPVLLIGCLLNAEAVAKKISQELEQTDLAVTLVCCGERWQKTKLDGELRFAVEDYLAAGAILSHLLADKSPEARVCEAAFQCCQNSLDEIIWECESGIELRDAGYAHDVSYTSQLNLHETVAVMQEGYLIEMK